jgi:TolB-like protein/DNA-binding winged helix-turn-helix (wHTH) protein/Tfp pilus assembly protein PilF
VAGHIYQFGKFRLDERARMLLRDGQPASITPKVFDTLLFLVANAGRTVTREELIQAVWPDTFVEEGNLNYNMSQLRTILGESTPGVSFVQTVPKRGYRFVADITEEKRDLLAARRSRLWLGAAAICVSIIVAGGAVLWRTKFTKTKPHQIRSIAVLPLRNLSRDADQGYFADGMTEALTTGLAQISALSVIAESSLTRYSGTKKAASEIARELQVDALVEGTVQRSGGRVMISAHLIDGSSNRQLWAKSFERDLRDVLALENEVAQAIAGEIGAKLTPQEQARLQHPRTVDPEAQEAYLWGVYWSQRKGGTEKSLEYLERSVRKDPGYASAYAALARTYQGASLYGVMPPEEAYSKSSAAVTKALELDDMLAEAHTALGGLLLFEDWKWYDAEREFQRAVQLNPNLPDTHRDYAVCLMALGRIDEAIVEMKKKVQLDPFSPEGPRLLGQFLFRARRYDEAIQRIHKNLERSDLTPLDAASEHIALGLAYFFKGMYPQAIEELENGVKFSQTDPYVRMTSYGCLAFGYARAGHKAEALRNLALLKEFPLITDRAYHIAFVYGALGDKDQAFQWLDRAFQERSLMFSLIKTDPRIDPLRSDARYSQLLPRMGLPE